MVSRWAAYLSPRQAKHPPTPRDPKIHGRLGLDPQRWWEREVEEGWRGGGVGREGGGGASPDRPGGSAGLG